MELIEIEQRPMTQDKMQRWPTKCAKRPTRARRAFGAPSCTVCIGARDGEIGNVGGMPYGFWYGFSSRVDWCAMLPSKKSNRETASKSFDLSAASLLRHIQLSNYLLLAFLR